MGGRSDNKSLGGRVINLVTRSTVPQASWLSGDRIIAIDHEDVSQMSVKEITTIMTRKSDFERKLVLLAAPKVQ